jgi:DNA repair exonuclease SbcCD ATPase subunit
MSPRRHPRQPAGHPDPRIELQLSQIREARARVDRQRELIRIYQREIRDAGTEQNRHGHALRQNARNYGPAFEAATKAYHERVRLAQEKIDNAETAITEAQERAAELAAKLSDSDLAYL